MLKKLAAQYGGFDAIPLDNEDYVEYAKQDVRATANVYQQLLAQNVVSDDYLRREHDEERHPYITCRHRWHPRH